MKIGRFVLFLAVVFGGASAEAVSYKTWTGAQSDLFSDPRNWQEGSIPGLGEIVNFPQTTPIVVTNDLPALTVQSLNFQSATLNGNPLTVTSDVGVFAGTLTLNVAVTFPFSSGYGFFGKTRSVINANSFMNGGTMFLQGNDTDLEIDGGIFESRQTSFNAINFTSLTMTKPLSLSGDFYFRGGTLTTSMAGLGTGNSPAGVSALAFNLATNGVIGRPLHVESPLIGGTMVFKPSAGNNVPTSGAIDLLRDVHIGTSLRVAGPLSGGGTLTVDSGASLFLDAANNAYAGIITVASGGTLVPEVDSAFPSASFVSVASGGRFNIAGTVQHATSFTCAGTLALRPGAALHASTIALDGCQLELAIAPDAGTAPGGIPIIVNDGSAPVTGTFASLPEGATVMVNGVARQITYQGGDGNDVMLLPAELQDMWWVGSAENGWGMSLIQHGDRLFALIFAYDAQGQPTWFAMPGGTWDATRSSFEGTLYTPHGTPYFAYSASSLFVGNPRGTMTLRVDGDSQITITYTIDGISGTKKLAREPFGGGSPLGDHGDMWWGGAAQNGWGIAILEQAPTIFPIWYTYDANGNAVWFPVPVGSFTSPGHYEGRAYRTTGSPWLGTPYDPSRLHATDIGGFIVDFNGDGASLTYSIEGHSATVPLVKEPF